MWQQVERILTEAAQRSVESVAAFLPGVLALMMILLVALLLSAFVRVLVLRTLRGLEIALDISVQWTPDQPYVTEHP